MEEGPELRATSEDNMPTPAAISTVGSPFGGKLVAHKMAHPGTSMTAAGKNADIVNKIISFRHR